MKKPSERIIELGKKIIADRGWKGKTFSAVEGLDLRIEAMSMYLDEHSASSNGGEGKGEI